MFYVRDVALPEMGALVALGAVQGADETTVARTLRDHTMG